jgi:hypothetical protein
MDIEQATLQLTPLPPESFPAVAIIFGTVPSASTVAEGGVIESVTEANVTVAAAVLDGSSTDAAVMVMVASVAGGVPGAV